MFINSPFSLSIVGLKKHTTWLTILFECFGHYNNSPHCSWNSHLYNSSKKLDPFIAILMIDP